MGNLYSLWATGRARGVDDISKVFDGCCTCRICRALLCQQGGVAVQADNSNILKGKLLSKMLLCYQHWRLRILQHKGQAFCRICGIERDISAPGFKDSKQADDNMQVALDAKAHGNPRSHAKRL